MCFRTYIVRKESFNRLNVNLLVAEQGRAHTTDHDVDGNTNRDQEASRDGVHTRQVSDGGRTTENQHGADDDVGSKTGARCKPVVDCEQI